MSALIKIVIGALLVIGGIYWYFVSLPLGTGMTNFQALILAFKSAFGALVFVIGLFIIWLEADELKMRRQERKEKEEIEEKSDAEKIKEAVTMEKNNKYVCEKCGKEFDSKRGLSIHRIRSH